MLSYEYGAKKLGGIKMKQKMMMLLIVMLLLSGCFAKKEVLQSLENGKGKIKILCWDDERHFYEQYGSYFNMKYPDIELEIMDADKLDPPSETGKKVDPAVELKKLIEKHKPDVLQLDVKMFETYAQAGKLYGLDEMITQEKFDVEGYMPGLIDLLRTKGNGTLYGLTPSFQPQILYFNRDLFKEHHIEWPKNKMTWQQVIDLSARFTSIGTGQNKIYGLVSEGGRIEEVLNYFARTSSLQLLDAKREKLLIQSVAWKQAIKMATDAVRKQAFAFSDYETFRKGKAAMIIGSLWDAQHLGNEHYYEQGVKPINWDMVTMPVDPASPDESAYINIYRNIFAVTEQSQNKRAAWEFVSFINGLDMAKANSRTVHGAAPTRMQFLKELAGRSTEAIYLLKPTVDTSVGLDMDDDKVPVPFLRSFIPELGTMLKAIVDNKKTVDEAAAELETKGQQMLLKAKAEEKQKNNK